MSAQDEEYQNWCDETESKIKALNEIAHQVTVENNKWTEKWPNYCRDCGGWGGFTIPGVYSGPPERCYPEDFDLCNALPEDRCHRCSGELQAQKDGVQPGPCKTCGWNFDDGLRQ